MDRRHFLSRSKMLALFPVLPYYNLNASFSLDSSVEDLIEAAGNAESDKDRYELLKRIATHSEYEVEANILVEAADRWANGLEKYWSPEDNLASSIEEEKGYLGGFFAIRSFPEGVFEFLQSGTIDLSGALPEGFEIPEENYPEQIPETSDLYPIWAMYKGRMIIWSAIELGLGELFYFSAASDLLSIAYQRFPNNPILAIYNGSSHLWPNSYQPSGNAPEWANDMRTVLNKLMDVIDFWIEERQAPDGQLGGGWGDDVEVWRRWIPILIGFDVPHVNKAMRKLANGMWDLERMEGGYTSILSDVEHSSEDSSDTLSMMILMQEPGSWNSKVDRLQELLTDFWTGINNQGHRQFKSTYFTSDSVSSDADLGYQVNYHFRALQPLLINWYRTNAVDQSSVLEILDGIIESTLSDAHGKPAGIPPAAMQWPSGEHGGAFDWWTPDAMSGTSQGTFFFPRYIESLLTVFAQAYAVTGEARYKNFLEGIILLRNNQLEGQYPTTSEEGTIGWAAKQVGKKITGAMEKLQSIGQPLDTDIPSQHSSYCRWVTEGDFSGLASYIQEQQEAFAYNRAMFMEEVRFTDRLDKFNDGYLNEHLGMNLAKPNMNALYSLLTGDPGTPFYFPLNQVRWKADPRSTAVRVRNMTEYLEIDLHNFRQESQSVRMELIARDEAYVQWENGFIQPVNRYLNLHISPDTTISYKVLFAIPSDGRFGDFEVNLYPNPFVDQLNYVISWNAIKTQRGRIDILDLNGQEVYRQAIQIQTGENTIVGNWKMTAIDKVNQGVYVFRVLDGNEVLLTQKIVKH